MIRHAPAYLAWTDAAGVYQTLTFDLVEDERWTFPADITKHPVDSGPNITDNIRTGLRKVTLKVVATNEPVTSNQWATGVLASAGPITLTNQQAINIAQALGGGGPTVSVTPGDGVITVPDWDSELELRILAQTVGGAAGSAAAGSAGGTAGAIAAGAVAGALAQGHEVDRVLKTNAPSVPPLGPPDTITPTVLSFSTTDDFVGATIALLEQLWASAQTLDVFGTKSTCLGPGASAGSGGPSGLGGMAIANFEYIRNKETGTGAEITLELEEVRIVYTTTVPAPKPTQPDSAASVSKGNQGTFDFAADANAEDAVSPFVQGLNAGEADAQAALQ